MSDPIVVKIPLETPAIHVDALPGQTITLRGFYTSRHDGSVIDAATTSWPKESAGGASVDAVGFIAVESGGFHLSKRDVDKHEAELVATGSGAEACAAAGVASPCLVLNTQIARQKRLMTWEEFRSSLSGEGIEAVLPAPPIAPVVAPAAVPYLQFSAGIAVALIVTAIAWKRKKRQDASPTGKLLTLARNVKERLGRADQVLAAPLAPAVDAAIKALREGRVDPASKEGKRVAEALHRVSTRLETAAAEEKAAKEQEAADELVAEMEAAIEAAEEVKRAHGGG